MDGVAPAKPGPESSTVSAGVRGAGAVVGASGSGDGAEGVGTEGATWAVFKDEIIRCSDLREWNGGVARLPWPPRSDRRRV
jgi:hypothetical protein